MLTYALNKEGALVGVDDVKTGNRFCKPLLQQFPLRLLIMRTTAGLRRL